MSKGKRVCAFCGARADSREHVFRRAWKKRFPKRPMGDYIQEAEDGTVSVRPEPPFELKVRRVCQKCNSGWMNRLDDVAEKWVFGLRDSDSIEFTADEVYELRRWAVKVAMMRWMTDQDRDVVHPSEYAKVREGRVPDGWHVLIGHTQDSFIHGACGWPHNLLLSDPTRVVGVRQASWALGQVITVVIRAVWPPGEHPPVDPLAPFREVNERNGDPMMELGEGAMTFDATARPKVPDSQVPRMFWFYSLKPN